MSQSETSNSGAKGLFAKLGAGDLLLTFGLFGTVIILILPLPTGILDLLLVTSIGLALLILLVIIYIKEPPEFSGFPTVLLAVTIFRLGLNVASTRLILLQGDAGNVIDAFGSFVVRDNYIVGAVIFLILVLVNFIVITKGSGRIAEVAARFTLDALPGKQMAIDAELNAGIIDEASATHRRQKVQKEADFYGAMDGASKFVRGDAVAGILITLINVIGGITIGVVQHGMQVGDALQKFTLLSIGDGLVSQIPALVVSLSAGILVTRASDRDNLGAFITRQLTAYPKAIALLSGMLLVLGMIPGLPTLPFFVLGSIAGIVALTLHRKHAPARARTGKGPASETTPSAASAPAGQVDFDKLIEVDLFALEIGFNLLSLADRKQGGDLLERVTGVRKAIARELGIVVPPIAVRDNMELDSNEYRFLLRNREVARGKLIPNRQLAMNVSASKTTLQGIPTVEPVFGIEAVWIAEDERKKAELSGFSIVDPGSVLITHLSEILKNHAHQLLGRQEVQQLVDRMKSRNPTLISELLPDLVSIGIIQRVLQNLLREQVSIRNLSLILEVIADYASLTKNPDDLSEQARRRLGEFFIPEYEYTPGRLRSISLDPRLEQTLAGKVQKTATDLTLALDAGITQHLLRELSSRCAEMAGKGTVPVLTVSAEIRLAFKRFFEPSLPKLTVLSFQELPVRTEIETFAIVPWPSATTVPVPALAELPAI